MDVMPGRWLITACLAHCKVECSRGVVVERSVTRDQLWMDGAVNDVGDVAGLLAGQQYDMVVMHDVESRSVGVVNRNQRWWNEVESASGAS